MIEVERKFKLTKETTDNLIKIAQFLKEIIFTDTYYDTPDYKLTTNDLWLRKRNDKWELKIPLVKHSMDSSTQYKELDTEKEIQKYLKLSSGSLQENYMPVVTVKTTRQKYKYEDFIIDIDVCQADNFIHHIGEIELMVETEKDVPNAIEKIDAFAHKYKLSFAPVRGKILEYIKLKKPEHYQALLKAGVTKEI